jgi:4-hydroxy-2-oxoheptanedioate aldolase
MEHFEVLLVGPNDLAASLGVPGQIYHEKVENAMTEVARKIKGTGKALATTFSSVEDCRRWIREGYRMMNVGTALAHGTIATKRIFAELREEFGP